MTSISTSRRYFYPRSPCGERHMTAGVICITKTFLSTLSLRRATSAEQLRTVSVKNFYPRSPCGERQGVYFNSFSLNIFLSTLSLRRATAACTAIASRSDISIHALLAESDELLAERFCNTLISIHALLAESDPGKIWSTAFAWYFYPRSPCGERLSLSA